ncbi:hypothetical protein CgunFtcFv8_003546 [Champsocephalus gunnari]|uniref:Uncharacterized protein n=1 Tax=Champsocephalus gunnari TaxID=52237 RepID=A0AAN8HXK3_CHAGU|nr:hypothetical protein CgunFtcFv8_003546 [Champsocephalus gunnari]
MSPSELLWAQTTHQSPHSRELCCLTPACNAETFCRSPETAAHPVQSQDEKNSKWKAAEALQVCCVESGGGHVEDRLVTIGTAATTSSPPPTTRIPAPYTPLHPVQVICTWRRLRMEMLSQSTH